MLSDRPVLPALPAQDIERAKTFYKEKLDMSPTRESEGDLFYECGDGTGFLVFLSSGSSRGDFTQMGWDVHDLDETVRDLTARGVTFEQYDFPGLKTDEAGIADLGGDRNAWFKDSEGNLISLHSSAG